MLSLDTWSSHFFNHVSFGLFCVTMPDLVILPCKEIACIDGCDVGPVWCTYLIYAIYRLHLHGNCWMVFWYGSQKKRTCLCMLSASVACRYRLVSASWIPLHKVFRNKLNLSTVKVRCLVDLYSCLWQQHTHWANWGCSRVWEGRRAEHL